MPRKSFSIHSDYYGAIKKLTNEQRGLLLWSLVEWACDEESGSSEAVVDLLKDLMVGSIKRISARNSSNGAAGGRPKSEKSEKTEKSEAPQKKPTVTVTVTDTVTSNNNPPLSPQGEQKKGNGDFGHVMLTENEYQKLVDGWQESDLDAKITSLDCGIENGIKKYCAYRSHYATLLNWLKKDCIPKPKVQPPVMKPDVGNPKIRGGMSWAEMLDTLDT